MAFDHARRQESFLSHVRGAEKGATTALKLCLRECGHILACLRAQKGYPGGAINNEECKFLRRQFVI